MNLILIIALYLTRNFLQIRSLIYNNTLTDYLETTLIQEEKSIFEFPQLEKVSNPYKINIQKNNTNYCSPLSVFPLIRNLQNGKINSKNHIFSILNNNTIIFDKITKEIIINKGDLLKKSNNIKVPIYFNLSKKLYLLPQEKNLSLVLIHNGYFVLIKISNNNNLSIEKNLFNKDFQKINCINIKYEENCLYCLNENKEFIKDFCIDLINNKLQNFNDFSANFFNFTKKIQIIDFFVEKGEIFILEKINGIIVKKIKGFSNFVMKYSINNTRKFKKINSTILILGKNLKNGNFIFNEIFIKENNSSLNKTFIKNREIIMGKTEIKNFYLIQDFLIIQEENLIKITQHSIFYKFLRNVQVFSFLQENLLNLIEKTQENTILLIFPDRIERNLIMNENIQLECFIPKTEKKSFFKIKVNFFTNYCNKNNKKNQFENTCKFIQTLTVRNFVIKEISSSKINYTWLIIGISIGLFFLIIFSVCFCICYRKLNKKYEEMKEEGTNKKKTSNFNEKKIIKETPRFTNVPQNEIDKNNKLENFDNMEALDNIYNEIYKK